jgi:hypothetical protein
MLPIVKVSVVSERGSLASLSGRLIRAASAALVLELAALSYFVTMLRAKTLKGNTATSVSSELEAGGHVWGFPRLLLCTRSRSLARS